MEIVLLVLRQSVAAREALFDKSACMCVCVCECVRVCECVCVSVSVSMSVSGCVWGVCV